MCHIKTTFLFFLLFFLFRLLGDDVVDFGIELAEVALLQVIAHKVQTLTLSIIHELIDDVLKFAVATLLDEDNGFVPGDLNYLEILFVLGITHDLEYLVCELNLDEHFEPVDHLDLGYFGAVVLAFVELVESDRPDPASRLDASEVELVVCHAPDDVLVVEPVPVEFVDVESGLLLLQPEHEAFVFEFDFFELAFAVDLVETLVDLCAYIFGLRHRIRPFLAHHARYLLQEHFVLTLDLDLPHLADHLLLAPVYHYRLRVVHQLRCNRLYLTQIRRVVRILDLLLLALHESVQVRTISVHWRLPR